MGSEPETPEGNAERVYTKVSLLKERTWLAKEYNSKAIGDYVLRIAKKEDSDKLAELYKESFPEYPYRKLHTEEYHLQCIDDPSIVRVVIKLNGEIVGAGALGINAPCLLGELKQAVVHPKYRGKGLMKPLIAVRTEIAENIGLEKTYTEARTREPAVQKALLDCGYKPVVIEYGQYVVYHKGGAVRENMILMVKYLNCGERRIDDKDDIIPEIWDMLRVSLEY